MIALTAEQKDLFSYVDQLTRGCDHWEYDFRDTKQYEFAKMMLGITGSASKYPGMLKTLELIKSIHVAGAAEKNSATDTTGWQNMFTIPGLNLKKSGTISSRGIGTVVNGYSSMNLTLMVQSKASKNIIAHGFSNSFARTLLAVNTLPSTSTETDVDAYLQYHGTSNGNVSLAGLIKKTNNDRTAIADPVVTAPVRTTTRPNNPKAINIGLGRAWTDQGGNSQFDYAWNEPVPPSGTNPKGKIPLVGNATFSNPISSPLVLNQNLVLNIYVVDQTGGGGSQLSPTDVEKVFLAFKIDPDNPSKLNWSLPAGISTSAPGNPIVFGNVPWASDTLAYFYCEIDVVLNDGKIASVYIESDDSPDQDPLDGTAYIKPIDFIWHCLAEDTSIAMADGSSRVIKEIVAGDKIKTDCQDGFSTVEWTNLGMHKGAVLRIETDSGATIVASDRHVFFADGVEKTAAEIVQGDKLEMRQGIGTVKAVDSVVYEGLLCNLATIIYQDPTQENAEIGVFYANDFLVGDVNAQRVARQKRINDIDWVKSQVPEYLHLDVASFFAENH